MYSLTAHPKEHGLTYLEHAWRSWNIAGAFFVLGAQAVLHGALPFVFQTSSTDGVRDWLPALLSDHA